MTVLAANFNRTEKVHDPAIVALPVLANAVIFGGALVVTDADGLAKPAADAASTIFQGVAIRGGLDNTGGANGTVGAVNARFVEVDQAGAWSFATTGTTPEAGQTAYVADDNTVSIAGGTNSLKCGRFVAPDALKSGNWFVDIERGLIV
jgi:hypothetical protein